MQKWIIIGSLGLFLGMPNPWLALPLLVLCYPLALLRLGLQASSWKSAWRLGMFTGTLGSGFSVYWLAIPIHEVGGLPWLLAAPCVFIMGAYLGIYAGLFSTLAFSLRKKSLCLKIVGLGLGWYLLEWVRGFFGTGFPWLSLASGFAFWPTAIQLVNIIGAYAFSGWVVSLVCLGALGLGLPRSRQVKLGLGLVVGVGLTFGYGWQQLQQPLTGTKVAVGLVQGNLDQNVKWDAAMQAMTVERYLSLSQAALQAKPRPQLLVWPETSMPFNFQKDTRFAPRIKQFVQAESVSLLFGSIGLEQNKSQQEVFNRAYVLQPSGRLSYYEKEHLVPFGEYLPPFLNLSFLEALLQGVGNFTPGINIQPVEVQSGIFTEQKPLVLGILICYETIFPELARQRVAAGAEVLLNISNDAWFGDSSAPWQHLGLSVLRAVEEKRYIIRSTNTGISAIIDAKGQIIAQGKVFVPEFLHGEVILQQGKTYFFHLAPYLPVASLLVLLYILITGLNLRKSFNLK